LILTSTGERGCSEEEEEEGKRDQIRRAFCRAFRTKKMKYIFVELSCCCYY